VSETAHAGSVRTQGCRVADEKNRINLMTKDQFPKPAPLVILPVDDSPSNFAIKPGGHA
jgi:hypothetical protein